MHSNRQLACRKASAVLRKFGNALPELLGKPNDDALGAADETEPVHVLVLSDFADEFSAMSTQAREDVIDIVICRLYGVRRYGH